MLHLKSCKMFEIAKPLKLLKTYPRYALYMVK